MICMRIFIKRPFPEKNNFTRQRGLGVKAKSNKIKLNTYNCSNVYENDS